MNAAGSLQVAFYLPNLNGGGAEKSMVILANGLVLRGWQCTFILNEEGGKYLEEVSENIHIEYLGTRRPIKSILRLSKKIKAIKPNALISTMVGPNYQAVLANILTGFRTRTILREASTPHIEYNIVNNTIKSRYILGKIFYRWGNVCVGNAVGVVESIKLFYGLPAKNIKLIFNGVNSQIATELAKEKVIHNWVDNNEITLLIAVGSVSQQKDYETLIRALHASNKAKDSNRLIIVGSKNENTAYFQKLCDLIDELGMKDRVEFVGFQKNPYKYMAVSDLFVLSSMCEGFPSVLIQALACGCTVVSTDCESGPNEILDTGAYGTLVPVGDWNAMAERINGIKKKDKNTKEIINRAEYFSIERNVSEYEKLIKSLIECVE